MKLRLICILALIFTFASSLSFAQNGLMVHYDFSGNATDQSGNGNNGTLHGGATAFDTLSLGDNTQDYLQIPSNTLNGLHAFAITFRIKFNSFHTSGTWPTNHILSGDQSYSTEAFGFAYDKDYLQWWFAFNGNLFTFSDPALQPGTWYCFLLERDSNGLISLYRDGIQNSSTYNYTNAINIQLLLLGQEDDCFGGCFAQEQCTNSKIDEFRIYNRPLTATEITNGCHEQISASQFSAGDTDVCEKFCVNFFDQSTNNPTAWHWIFPGGSPSSSTIQNPINICYDIPGVYDVTLITTNANGNDTLTQPGYITVYPTPPFPTIIQIGYTLTSSAASTYQWQFNSVDIPGATNQSYDVLQSGLYTVIVGNSNGCVNSANKYVLISGFAELSDATISIYPNPSSGNFMVELLNDLIAGEVSIEVVNTLGQKVFSCQQRINSADWKKEIDLGDVARGIYFIEIKTQKDYLKKKIIISK